MATVRSPGKPFLKSDQLPADRIRPLSDRVAVRPDEPEKVSSGGIHIPEEYQEERRTGTVEAVGLGKLDPKDGSRTPLDLKEGDCVVFRRFAGSKFDDFGLVILTQDEILGVIE